MINAEPIKKKYGDYLCRRCINKRYDADLKREDCRYGYAQKCRWCGEMRNPVIGFTASGKLKMLLK